LLRLAGLHVLPELVPVSEGNGVHAGFYLTRMGIVQQQFEQNLINFRL
jgi:hypothetical protein